MPSTYTVNLGIEKPATGEQSGTWGDTTNVNFDILDQAINGAVVLTLANPGTSGTPNLLEISNGSTSDGRNKWIELTDAGDLGGTSYLRLDPNDAEKIVFVRNNLSGGQSAILFQGTYSTSNDFEVPAGCDVVLKFDGNGTSATVVDVYNKLRVTALTTPLLTTADLTATTADINGGTIDSSVIGGATAAAVTGTTVVANTSLNIAADGATVTGIKDEDDMVSNSATKLATQQSIKAYVDAQVGSFDTLSEVLAQGNTSGTTNLVIDSGQVLTTNTVNETTVGTGVTIDSVLLKDDVVNATDIETSTISANDGTLAINIANTTGAVDIDTSLNVDGTVTADGLTVDGNADVNGTVTADGLVVSGAGVIKAPDGSASAPAYTNSGDTDGGIFFPAANQVAIATGGLERVRIDGAGNLLVGATAESDWGTASGFRTRPSGSTTITRSAAPVLYANRLTSDGAIQEFLKNGTTVGSINAYGGDLAIGTGAAGLRFLDSVTAVIPHNTTTNIGADAAIDLGFATGRFKDLYLSGEAIVGGMYTNTLGTSNFRAGVNAGNSIIAGGNYNTLVGDEAGGAITTGMGNTLAGTLAGDALQDADYNVALGYNALSADTLGNRSVAIGTSALEAQNFTSSTNTYNTAVGFSAGAAVTTGVQNTLIGSLVGDALTTGVENVALGFRALGADTLGNRSVAIGMQALANQNFISSTNTYNTAVGFNAGVSVTTAVNNTLIGAFTADSLTTGIHNVAIGRDALGSLTTGGFNVAIGYLALTSEDANGSTVAIGRQALQNQNAGTESYNVAIGSLAGAAITTGVNNVIIGGLAGDSLTAAGGNTAVGYGALSADTLGQRNVAIGHSALGTQNFTSSTDAYNTAVGFNAGVSLTTGIRNTIIGGLAGDAITTASNNTAVGYAALSAATTGTANVATGYNALAANTTGDFNVAMGYNALDANTTANDNVAVGTSALGGNTTGASNIAIGKNALVTNTIGTRNIAIGTSALDANTTANNNISIGVASLTTNTTGANNVAVGDQALSSNTTASNNTAVGDSALKANTTGTENVAVGAGALQAVTTGYENIGIGRGAGSGVTTANRNTFIGDDAGYLITGGSENTIIGRYTGNNGGLDIRTLSNNIVLSDGAGNPRLICNSGGRWGTGVNPDGIGGVGVATFSAKSTGTGHFAAAFEAYYGVGINAVTATGSLMYFYYNGGASPVGSINTNGTSTSFNTSSDHRLKENVVAMTGATARLKQLAPKRFNFIADADTTVDGFLAHEVQSVVPEAITGTHNEVDSDGNPVYQGIDQSKLVPLLVATIQELTARIEALEP